MNPKRVSDEALIRLIADNFTGSVSLMNVADSALPVVLRREDVCTEFKMEPHSIATVLL